MDRTPNALETFSLELSDSTIGRVEFRVVTASLQASCDVKVKNNLYNYDRCDTITSRDMPHSHLAPNEC